MAPDALIEERLVEIDAALGLRGRYRDRVIAEIRAHLLDAADAAVARGTRIRRRSSSRSPTLANQMRWPSASRRMPLRSPEHVVLRRSSGSSSAWWRRGS